MQLQPHPNPHADTHTHATAQVPAQAQAASQAPRDAHTHANSGSTCVTPKWLMPLNIRPSHALPLCACGTPKPTSFCRLPTISPTHAELFHGYTKLGQHIICPWFARHPHTPAPTGL
ncbi:hypothetical protein O181_096227 [Austropuccinia psidii MF-1]|uniref:Uncharacterized protein n=1 Tax=Austropuccinia psidii MF-1 TaxID=1389203 RepID=A0A9Q3J695_9BASI|nr:hypothetical protein [Austropuccinia psidii MF-1]